MLKNELIFKNPLRRMGYESDDILNRGEFGAVMARAGVGKTAFLVQLALNSMLREKKVLHISLDDPVKKVSLWYKEVFNRIATQYAIHQSAQLWDTVLPHRFIMTFRVEGFSVPKLEERLTDLIEQNIFKPHAMIIDGLPFADAVNQDLADLKNLANRQGMHVWFTVRTHRHEDPDPSGIPSQLIQVADLFDVAIQLLPVGKQIQIKAFKGPGAQGDQPDLMLDPATMLIQDQI
ncbi:MAG: AAA family ATPase [Desulfobacterales bacterium]